MERLEDVTHIRCVCRGRCQEAQDEQKGPQERALRERDSLSLWVLPEGRDPLLRL